MEQKRRRPNSQQKRRGWKSAPHFDLYFQPSRLDRVNPPIFKLYFTNRINRLERKGPRRGLDKILCKCGTDIPVRSR